MPYIKQSDRCEYNKAIDALVRELNTAPDGHINYAITVLLKRLYGSSYHDHNAAIGVLECVKQEFYRCVVALYEDKKKAENGDVG